MKMSRVFVGTLHSNEGDFEKCCEAISLQRNVVVTHKIISNMNERDAHNALWTTWREHQSTHDVFVKVDADTVLISDDTLATICHALESQKATGLQAPLHDFMTDNLINGLNAYTSDVVFHVTKDDLFCDRDICTGNTKILRDLELPPELRPAGFHGHYATSLQAFRFAIHRAMKDQRDSMQQLIYAWRRHKDRIRGMGVIGIMIAKRYAEKEKKRSDYSDENFIAAYNDAELRYDEYIQAINTGNLSIFD